MISPEYLGTRIRQRRKALGWSTVELARRAGVHHRTVEYVERGDRDPGLFTAQCILIALGLRVSISADWQASDPRADSEATIPAT